MSDQKKEIDILFSGIDKDLEELDSLIKNNNKTLSSNKKELTMLIESLRNTIKKDDN